ncbi:MAG: glycoside hydrolase family 3 protein [Deinococcus sp.]|nr:glycoside hydrolase family 3 protein [Deinococcus sp.]
MIQAPQRTVLLLIILLVGAGGALYLVSQPSLILPLEQAVGQLLIVTQSNLLPPTDLLQRYHPGGLFLGSAGTPDDLQALAAAVQTMVPMPPFLAVDHEGFRNFTTLTGPAYTPWPANMALGATGDPELAYQVGRVVASELRQVGVTVNFAPVVDVLTNLQNPIIGLRAFGSDPALVRDLAVAYARGLLDGGVMPVAKHFPGHGATALDSHQALECVERSRAELEAVDLVPYRALFALGLPAVMTARVCYPALEPAVPATLSHVALMELLRQELGFQRVVITDHTAMVGFREGGGPGVDLGELAVRAVLAGADMVLVGNDPGELDAVYGALLYAGQQGRLSVTRLNASLRRIFTLKQRIPAAPVALPPHLVPQDVRRRVAEASVTLIDPEGLVPLSPEAVVGVIETGRGNVGRDLAELHLRVRHYVLRGGGARSIQQALAAVEGAPVVVVTATAWQHRLEPPDELITQLQTSGVQLILVVKGDPLQAARYAQAPDAVVVTYGDDDESLRVAAEILAGKWPAQGHWPLGSLAWMGDSKCSRHQVWR